MHFLWDTIRYSFRIASYRFMFIAHGETAWGPSSFSPAVSANTNVCYIFSPPWKQTWNEIGLSVVPLTFTSLYARVWMGGGWRGKIRGWFQLEVVNRIKGLCSVAAKGSRLVTGWLLVRALKGISNEQFGTGFRNAVYLQQIFVCVIPGTFLTPLHIL